MIDEEPCCIVNNDAETDQQLIDTSSPQTLERDFYAWLKVEKFK